MMPVRMSVVVMIVGMRMRVRMVVSVTVLS